MIKLVPEERTEVVKGREAARLCPGLQHCDLRSSAKKIESSSKSSEPATDESDMEVLYRFRVRLSLHRTLASGNETYTQTNHCYRDPAMPIDAFMEENC